jgi:tetratricopeptide (TPR) repeat protein
LTAACATAQPSSRFVLKDGGFIDVGGPPADEQIAASADWDRAKQEALAVRAAQKAAAPQSIEELDPALRQALADLGAGQSVGRHLTVAEQYKRVGVRDLAFEHYSKALTLDPKSVSALDGRARLLRDVGLMNMALGDAHRARFVAPASAEARNTLGTILEKLGQCREASAAYREAARLSGGAEWATQNVTRLSASCPG